jgi:hypothetical protein
MFATVSNPDNIELSGFMVAGLDKVLGRAFIRGIIERR